jgi:hypothetical protein
LDIAAKQAVARGMPKQERSAEPRVDGTALQFNIAMLWPDRCEPELPVADEGQPAAIG